MSANMVLYLSIAFLAVTWLGSICSTKLPVRTPDAGDAWQRTTIRPPYQTKKVVGYVNKATGEQRSELEHQVIEYLKDKKRVTMAEVVIGLPVDNSTAQVRQIEEIMRSRDWQAIHVRTRHGKGVQRVWFADGVQPT